MSSIFSFFKGAPRNNDTERQVQILVNHGYVVGFSPERLQPLWSAYRVAGFDRDIDFDRPHLYYADQRLDSEYRVGPQTFGRINDVQYHVGHMVPNEVINRQFGRLAQMETFLMSNMSPQRGSLNSGAWLALENAIRNIEDTADKDHIWAIAGPIFGEEPEIVDRANGQKIPIPDAYYCVTVDPFRYPWDRPSNVDVVSFILPQETESNTPLDELIVPLSDVEAATNLHFFPGWESETQGGAMLEGLESREMEAPNLRHRILQILNR